MNETILNGLLNLFAIFASSVRIEREQASRAVHSYLSSTSGCVPIKSILNSTTRCAICMTIRSLWLTKSRLFGIYANMNESKVESRRNNCFDWIRFVGVLPITNERGGGSTSGSVPPGSWYFFDPSGRIWRCACLYHRANFFVFADDQRRRWSGCQPYHTERDGRIHPCALYPSLRQTYFHLSREWAGLYERYSAFVGYVLCLAT